MTRNDRFNMRMRNAICPSELDDGGAGVEILVATLDGEQLREEADRDCEDVQREIIRLVFGVYLMLTERAHLVPTFDLICENGAQHRAYSIATLTNLTNPDQQKALANAERTYRRHRAALLTMSANGAI